MTYLGLVSAHILNSCFPINKCFHSPRDTTLLDSLFLHGALFLVEAAAPLRKQSSPAARAKDRRCSSARLAQFFLSGWGEL